MDEGRLKTAVVGMGKMGLLHSCVLRVLPDVDLVAVCEKSFFVRRLLKRLLGQTLVVDDLNKLSGLNLDAVYVTTPIPSHFVVTKTLFENNIAHSMFVEKTLASNYAQAQKLCELADATQGTNMVGYLRRYYVTFKKAKDLLSQKAVGEVRSFKAYAYSSDFLGVKQTTAPASRGGVLRDLGCHAVDLALWYFGEMHVNTAEMKSIVADDSEDIVNFRVENGHGLEGEFAFSWCEENYRMPEVGLRIVGSKGSIEVNDDKVRLETARNGSSQWYRHDLNDNVAFWLGLPEYYREDSIFVKMVREHKPGEPNFQAASEVDEILDDVEKRADKNE